MTTSLPKPIAVTDKRGLDLVHHVRNHIGDNRDQWDQQCWSESTACGTTFCFAGFAVIASGGEMVYRDCGIAGTCVDANGVDQVIETYAAELLGLDEDQACRLFFSPTDIHYLDAIIADIEGGVSEQ